MDANSAPLPPQVGGSGGSSAGGTSASNTASNAPGTSGQKLRKRTKTGCLTCRKRRIKCGEERPICNNCIKSKRTCEGYNQRISWKPLIDWGGLADDGQALQFHSGMLAPPISGFRPAPPPIDTAGFMPMRTPHSQPYTVGENREPVFSPPNSSIPFMQNMDRLPRASPQTPYPQAWTPLTPQYGQSVYGQSPMSAISTQSLTPNFAAPTQQMPMNVSSHDARNLNNEQMFQQFRRPSQPTTNLPTSATSVQQEPTSFLFESSLQPNQNEPIQPQLVGPVCWLHPPGATSSQQTGAPQDSWAPTAGLQVSVAPPINPPAVSAPQAAKFLGESLAGATAQFLEDAAIETYDVDYFDVESDEEMETAPEKTFQQLSLVRKLHQDHMHELSMRRYDTFIYSGMLDHYRAEEHANPLGNPKTARVFVHFISATGPSLSIFERHPRNPSAMFNEMLSDHQQGLWTHRLPMMALRHQGLLHAMLALASLHIAKLQGTSSMPSYKHYAYAIKRIHKSVGIESKKLLPTTIAATLLLGFYEILTADHLKWSSHLAGAKQLLQAIPFKRMSKEARKLRAQRLAQKDQFAFYDSNQFGSGPDLNFKDLSTNIDESLVSILMGRHVKIEQFGQVLDEEENNDASQGPASSFDPEKYALYQDLYWWYARQDVYQAILSGNKLLLDYHRWTDCPPRASMGRADAIYGTHDHLILLFARIADFNARDRRRKIKVMEANGGQWRPPPDMNIPIPSGAPPFQGMPPQSNNPNAPFMHPGAGQGHRSMPQPPNSQHFAPHHSSTNAPASTFNQAPPPSTGYGQGPIPPGLESFLQGQNNPPFAAAGLQTPLQTHIAQTPTGISPNFRTEQAFNEGSPNAPYSAQAGFTGTHTQADSQGRSHGPPPPAPPLFYGMAPLPTTVNMPSSYASNAYSSPSPKSEKSDYDLDAATQSALNEWTQLKAALNTFESHLGPHFQPMPSDVHPSTMTPFGPAIFYRSHDVGIIWAMYYMACIIVQRCHPHMPPAAMVAAGVAARQTGLYATRIGQIIGGIAPPVMGPSLSPNLGACLCESSLPLFFAGVQYQDSEQRRWLVNLLRNVENRTGWKSVGMVAQGCETAWERAFEMKRGPPYKRTFDQWHMETLYDSRVARITGNYTALDHDHPDISGRIPRDLQGTRVHWAMGILGEVENDDESESRHISGIQPSKAPVE